MGVFDEYNGIQLKIGNCACRNFKVGDKVNISDGAYLGYEGIVIIIDGVFVKSFPFLIDKWGCLISLEGAIHGILNERNAVTKVVNKMIKKRKKKKK